MKATGQGSLKTVCFRVPSRMQVGMQKTMGVHAGQHGILMHRRPDVPRLSIILELCHLSLGKRCRHLL